MELQLEKFYLFLFVDVMACQHSKAIHKFIESLNSNAPPFKKLFMGTGWKSFRPSLEQNFRMKIVAQKNYHKCFLVNPDSIAGNKFDVVSCKRQNSGSTLRTLAPKLNYLYFLKILKKPCWFIAPNLPWQWDNIDPFNPFSNFRFGFLSKKDQVVYFIYLLH